MRSPQADWLYTGRVPVGADLITYWFEKARAQIVTSKAGAVGLVATNSIRGGANPPCWNASSALKPEPSRENPMPTIRVDTLPRVDKLKAAGFPPEQAEAVVRAISEAQSALVTKADLEQALAPLRTDLTVLKWMMEMLLAGVMSLVLKGFF